MIPLTKPIRWIGSSLEDLRAFPPEARRAVGYALYFAQMGDKHPSAKPLKGFGGAGVLEIVEDYDGNTFRVVYTLKFSEAVYVLHAFQKKSKKGVRTPKREMDLVGERLKRARENHDAKQKRGKS